MPSTDQENSWSFRCGALAIFSIRDTADWSSRATYDSNSLLETPLWRMIEESVPTRSSE